MLTPNLFIACLDDMEYDVNFGWTHSASEHIFGAKAKNEDKDGMQSVFGSWQLLHSQLHTTRTWNCNLKCNQSHGMK